MVSIGATGEVVDLTEIRQRKDIKKWVERKLLPRTDFSITLNFEHGVTVDAARKAVSIFMNQVDRNLLNCRDASKHPDKRCRWFAFPEGQQWDKRLHFHVQVSLCPDFSGDDLKGAVQKTYDYMMSRRRFGFVTEKDGCPWIQSTSKGYHSYVTKEIMENDRSLEQAVTHADKVLYHLPSVT